MRRSLLVGAFLLGALGGVAAGCSGPGPWNEKIETAVPEVADVDAYATGERFRFVRIDAEPGFLGKSSASVHDQYYRPTGGHSVEELYVEVMDHVIAGGWSLERPDALSDERDSGTKIGADGMGYNIVVSIVRVPVVDSLRDDVPYVYVGLGESSDP